jgi:hypothetical protein
MPSKHHEFSPSKMERFALCPGSFQFKPPQDEISSKASEDGTLLHDIMAGDKDISVLDGRDDRLDLISVLDDMTADMELFTEGKPFLREQWIQLIGDDFEVLTAGTADLVQVLDDKVRILDYKTGRVWVAPTSLQLKVYAACAMQTYSKPVAEVAISQPRAGGMKPMMYSDYDALYAEITGVITACKAENPVFMAGEHCKYCPGKLTCTARIATQDDAVMALAERNIALMTPEHIGDMTKKAKMVKKVCEEIEAHCRTLTLSGENTGYKIIEKAGRSAISDPARVVAMLVDDIGQEEIVSEAVTLSLAKLKKLYAEKKKETSGRTKKELEKELEDKLGDLITRGAPAQTMVEE